MRAVWLTGFGGPEVLTGGDAPDPVPGPGQALIEVAYANITFIETQFRATGFGPFTAGPPMIPGNGVGGLVSQVGAGADAGLVGKRVVTGTGGSGGYAQLAVADASALFEVPDALGLDAAVAVLADGRTATALVASASIRPGERVLVEAAAGGVGSLLVQLAMTAGAEVIGTAGGAAKVRQVGDLGADLAIDYREPGWPERVGGPVDVVFDGVGGEIGATSYALLRDGGRMVVFGLSSGSWTELSEEDAHARGVTIVRPSWTPSDLRRYTESALAEAADGRLVPVIGQRFPLERAADAHAAIEARTTIGKTLLSIARPRSSGQGGA